ncbi:hypothetical protein [Streptomyces sp. NBC_01013]|uniref:hypothetical protein n=1 Tax=Streptomyces sp. NBC_01013 TaxID=2903718 RepID=UPI003863294C|nr:hypothetical protein OG538_15760 [Streptomyces sp. NBC_01013]
MDALTIVGEIGPYVSAAVGAYGTAVLTRATDVGADATVGLGRRILQRIRGSQEDPTELDRAVAEAAEAPDDADFQAMLRVQIKRALLADPELTAGVAQLLTESSVSFTASGDGAVAVQHNSGVISTGNNAQIQR